MSVNSILKLVSLYGSKLPSKTDAYFMVLRSLYRNLESEDSLDL